MARATAVRCPQQLLALLVACVILAAAPIDTSAQHSLVRGFVTDSTTEQSLQGASVLLQSGTGATYGAATDGDGYFVIRRVPPGRYRFTVSFIGYTTHREDIELRPGAVLQRRVLLGQREAALDELVVQAEAEGGVAAVAAGLQAIVPAQIERVPVPGVTGDLASYLQTVPGVVVQGDRGGQFFVRGGALDQNLALLDGLPVYMPIHVLSFYSVFPQEIIDTADLYTGGFGARYGTRVSSVVDVTARKGNKQNLAGEVSLAPFLATARIEGPLVKDKVSIIASARESLVETLMPDLLGQGFPYSFGDRFGKLHAFLNPSNSISFTALHTSDRGDLAGSSQDFSGSTVATAVSDSNEASWNNLVTGGRYVYLPGFAPMVAEFTAGYSEATNEFGRRDSADQSSEIRSVDATAHFTYFLGDSKLRFGTTYRSSTYEYQLSGQFQNLETGRDDLTEVNAYVESDIDIPAARLSVQPGLNVYVLPDRSKQWFEPRARLMLRPGGAAGRQQFHAAWGIYHQVVVGLNDERNIGNTFTAWTVTPQNLPVPESMHAIVGWNMRLAPWLSIAAEAFYKDLKNLSVPIFSAFPRLTTALQSADGEARGADVRIDFRDRPFYYESVLDGYVSYSVSSVEYTTAKLTYRPAHDRRHQINALLHAQRGPIGFTLQWQFGTGLPFTEFGGFDAWHLTTPELDVATEAGLQRLLYDAPFEGRQPNYNRVDLWFERKFERDRVVGTLRAGVVNVLNRDNLFYYDLFTSNRVDQVPVLPSVGFKLELR